MLTLLFKTSLINKEYMMMVKVINLLNKEEKKMLAEISKIRPHLTQSQQARNHDLVNCQMSSKLKNCLVDGTNIGLVIHHELYDIIYPIFCSFDDQGQEIIGVNISEVVKNYRNKRLFTETPIVKILN
jgi:hypothetical protein